MKPKILTLLLLCLPILLCAQNYEKEGDELFAQAQYEKAIKKYRAAIEFMGQTATIQQKIEKSNNCIRLLEKATSAEKQADDITSYERASKYYLDLYEEHPLATFKNKANTMQRKADAITEAHKEQKQKMIEQRESKQKIERWRQNRIMRLRNQLQDNAYRSKQPNAYELTYELPINYGREGEWEQSDFYRKFIISIRAEENYQTIVTLRMSIGKSLSDFIILLNKYQHLGTKKLLNNSSSQSDKYILGEYDQNASESQIVTETEENMHLLKQMRDQYNMFKNEEKVKQNKQIEEQDKQIEIQERIRQVAILKKILLAPLGIENINWIDTKRKQKRCLLEQCPQLSVIDKYILAGNFELTNCLNYYYDINYVQFDLNSKDGIYVSYMMKAPTPTDAIKTWGKIYLDMINLGLKMTTYNEGESMSVNGGILDKILFNWIRLKCDDNIIYIQFEVNRVKSKKNNQMRNKNDQQLLTILFYEYEHDFGVINETNGKVSTFLKFKNNGKNPLVFGSIQASNGCTAELLSTQPIMQGKTGLLLVTFDPNGYSGYFHKTITITSNAPEGTTKVYIKGDVIPK